jgi:YidC/Oxa1 family membrane protein insertase
MGNNHITLFDGKDQAAELTRLAKETNISTKICSSNHQALQTPPLPLPRKQHAGKSIIMQYLLGKDYMLHMKFQH